MGFFKDLRDVNKQAKELGRTSDPGARFQEMGGKLAALNASMARETAVLTAAPGDTVDGQVQLVAVEHGPRSVNGEPVVSADVLVLAPGRPPIPTTVTLTIPLAHLHQAQAGATIPARIAIADPTAFTLAWPNA
jgi:hypothetical protein